MQKKTPKQDQKKAKKKKSKNKIQALFFVVVANLPFSFHLKRTYCAFPFFLHMYTLSWTNNKYKKKPVSETHRREGSALDCFSTSGPV